MYKKGVFEGKEGGLSLKKEGVWGFSRRKKRGPRGVRETRKKRGRGGQISEGGSPSPSHFLME